MNSANRQSTAKIIPVGRRRARREHLTEHRDLLTGVKYLAQYVGAGALSADHYESLNVPRSTIGIQPFQAWRIKICHAGLAPMTILSTALRLRSQAAQN